MVRVARPRIVLALALLMAASLALRTSALGTGYWVDEGIAVGIASHPLGAIPSVLGQDGSPPLYYLLLHVWMSVFGTSEDATHALSLLFAMLTIPVSFWAGARLFDRKAGALAAAGAAGCPFLTYYATETRMYSLVVLLGLLASTSFVLAFVRGERRHVIYLGVWLSLLLYTHMWGFFLAAAMGLAWLRMWRRGQVQARDGVRLAIAVAIVYAPWVPSMLEQAANTAAPWSERPSPLLLLGIPAGLFGYVAIPLLAVAVIEAVRRRRPLDPAVRTLILLTAATAVLAWSASQVQPAWSTRYLAVLLGPLLLALASVVSRGARWSAVALLGVGVVWALSGPPPMKSNVRSVSDDVAPALYPGDLVISTQPEQVPALYRYLPEGVAYLTPMGLVGDPRQTDWRDGLARMKAGTAANELLPALLALPRGRRVLMITPANPPHLSEAPWAREIRIRTREWRRVLRAQPHLERISEIPASAFPSHKNIVRADLYVVT